MSRLAKPIPVTLDKERALFFDLNATCAVQEETGKSIFEFFPEVEQKEGEDSLIYKFKDARSIRLLVWAGLLHEDDTLTVKQVGKMLKPFNNDAVITQLLLALAQAFESDPPTAESPDAKPASQS